MADDASESSPGIPNCAFLSTDFGWSVFERDSYPLRIGHAVSSICETLHNHAHHTTEALCTQLREFATLLNLVPGKHGQLLPTHADQLLDCILPLLESESTSDCLLEQLCKILLCKGLVIKSAKHTCNWRAIAHRWSQMYADGNKERGKFSMQAYTFTRNPLGLVNPLLNDVAAKLGVLFAPDSFIEIYNFFQPVAPPHKSYICSYFFMQSLLKNCHRDEGINYESLLLDVFRKWELSFVLRQRSGMSCDLYFMRIIQIVVRPKEKKSVHTVHPLPPALRDVLFSRIFYGLNAPAGKGHSSYNSSDGGSRKNVKVASACAATLVLLLPSDPDAYLDFFLSTISKVEHLLYPSNRNSAAPRISKFICKFVSLVLRRMRLLAIDFPDDSPLLSAAQIHRLVSSLSPTVLNALYYEDSSVVLMSRVSLFKMLYLDSLAIIPGIVKRVHSALEDGITSPHQTTAIISLANSLVRIILITAHPFVLPDALSSDMKSRLLFVHSYGTKEDQLLVRFQQSQEDYSSTILNLDESGVAATKASFLRLIPVLLNNILPYVSASNISMCCRALDFFCNFMNHAPLFELPADAIKPLYTHDILWAAIKDVSRHFSVWSSAFLEQILFLVSTVGAAHEQDASQVSSSVSNLKKSLLLILSHLPHQEWTDIQSPCMTRQRALDLIVEFIETTYIPNDSPSMNAVVYAAVVSGDFGMCQRLLKFLFSKMLRCIETQPPSSPSASGTPTFSFSGMVLGTKNMKELRFYTSILHQVVTTCRDASFLVCFNLQFCGLMHCLLNVEDEEAFEASLDLLYALFSSQCRPLLSPVFCEYRCVPESLWNNQEWRRVSYASWGRGVNEYSSELNCGPMTCNKVLIESLKELFIQRIEMLCSNAKMSGLALNNNLKIISTVLMAIRLYPRKEFPTDDEVYMGSRRAAHVLQYQQLTKDFPLFSYSEEFCSLKWWTVSSLLLRMFQSLLSHAKDGIQIAASLCNICHVWYSKLTYTAASYDSDLSIEVPRRLQRWTRLELARNWEAIMLNFCAYNSNTRTTVHNDIQLVKELMQLLCHPVESVRTKANVAVESLCHSLGFEVLQEVVPFTLNIIKDTASPSCSFAGASLFLTLPSTTKYIQQNWHVRCEVARALLSVHKRIAKTEPEHEVLFWAMENALWDFFHPTIDLPIHEMDHPKVLLSDIDANILEISSMHWSYAEMLLRIAEIFRMSRRCTVSPSTMKLYMKLLPSATGPMLVTKHRQPYESVGCYDTIVQCINYALDHVIKRLRKSILGPSALPKFAPDSGWKTFSFNPSPPCTIQHLLDQRKKERSVWLSSLNFSLDPEDSEILKIAESIFADAEVFSGFVRINISNFVPYSSPDSGGGSANIAPSANKICNVTLFKQLTSLFGTFCTDPIIQFIEQVVAEIGFISAAASDSVYLPRQLLASEMFAGVSLGIKYLPKDVAYSIEQRLGSCLMAIVNHDSSLPKVEVMWWSALAMVVQDLHPLQMSWLLEATLQPLSPAGVAASTTSTSHPLCKRLRCARRVISNCVWGTWPLQLEFMRSVCLVAIHPSSQVRNCAIMCIIAAVDEVWNCDFVESSSLVHPILDSCFVDLISRIHNTIPTLKLNSPDFKSTKDFVIVLFKHAGGLPFRSLFVPMIRLIFRLISLSEKDDAFLPSKFSLHHQGCPLFEYIVAVSNLTVFSPAVVDDVIAVCIEQSLSENWHVRHAVSPVLEVLCFRHSTCISPSRRLDVATSLSSLLKDPLVEVRNSAKAALPSIFRICNQEERSHFSLLYMTWSKDAEAFVKKKAASEHLTLRHAGVLGLSSLIQFEPFSVLEWMPALLERLAVHTSDPEPIKTSALLFFSQFWTSHRDSWNLYASMFNPALLDTLMELFRGHRSYYL